MPKFSVGDEVQIRNAEWPVVDGWTGPILDIYIHPITHETYYEIRLPQGDGDSPTPYNVTIHEGALAFPEESDPDGYYE